MIKKLKLEAFGRFHNTSFPMTQTTVFFGPNESGKTTIFDAIAIALCAPTKGKKSSEWEAIHKRYEGFLPPEIETTARVSLDYGKFFNFFAIRSGESSIEFEEEKNWLSDMRSRLFSGGYDITRLSTRFTNLVESRQKDAYPRLIAECEQELQRYQQEIKQLTDEAQRYKNSLELLQKTEATLKEITSTLEEKLSRRKKLQTELEHLEQKLEASNIQHWIKLYEKYESIRDDIARHYAGLEENEILSLENKAKEIEKTRTTLQQDIAILARKQSTLQILLSQIAHINEEIHTREREQKKKNTLAFFLSLTSGLFGLLAIASATIVFFLSRIPWYIGIITGSVFFFMGILTLFGSFLVKKDTLTTPLRSEIENAYQEALRENLIFSRPSNWENFCQDIAKLQESFSALFREKQQSLENLKKTEEEFQTSYQRFCFEHNVSSLAVARERLDELKQKNSEMNTILHALETHPLRDKSHTLEEQYHHFKTRLENLSPTDLDSAKNAQQQKVALKNQLVSLEDEIQKLEAKKQQLSENRVQIRTELLAMETAMQAYAAKKTEAQRLEKRKEILSQEKQACEKILAIFSEIENKQASVFTILAEEVKKEFGDIFPPFKEIEIQAFSEEAIRIPDATATRRPLKYLSRGTQDLFYLALRLFLGRKMWDDPNTPGLFLLDEPFAALDENRTQIALKILQHFQNLYHWQYIILTKDENLVNLFKTWPEVTIHTLSRSLL
ncbi:ATP-binding protein [Thermospira aquatica]|uniref:AAA family ATPase n=1 Tax=Thermospira aquatica TaxID=2828656 RepID=A0AAX3BFZ0_9SPIR|nr:AAA family ATPase [Thermospira aquatica]URA11110.1 AAA family ATPase [Thermospira aquatica]